MSKDLITLLNFWPILRNLIKTMCQVRWKKNLSRVEGLAIINLYGVTTHIKMTFLITYWLEYFRVGVCLSNLIMVVKSLCWHMLVDLIIRQRPNTTHMRSACNYLNDFNILMLFLWQSIHFGYWLPTLQVFYGIILIHKKVG